MKFIHTSLTIVLLITLSAYAEILNVPDDFETITAAIEAAQDGDIVLVARGEYFENISIEVKNIIVTSHFINTNDEEDILNTIIHAAEQSEASVIAVTNPNESDATFEINGITLRGGNTDYGGGVYNAGSNIVIANTIITGNEVSRSGGGIYLTRGANARIVNTEVRDNIANGTSLSAGGIALRGAFAELDNVKIVANVGSTSNIGGITISHESEVLIQNSLFSSNQYTPFLVSSSNVTLSNSVITNHNSSIIGAYYSSITFDRVIIYGNNATTLFQLNMNNSNNVFTLKNSTVYGNNTEYYFNVPDIGNGKVNIVNTILYAIADRQPQQSQLRCYANISYSVFRGDRNRLYGDRIQWGEGVTDIDPMLVDSENGDLRLRFDSPCVDAGDPESERDEDGSISDIGAIPVIHRVVLSGIVTDAITSDPVENAIVTIGNGRSSISDENGSYLLERVPAYYQSITVSHPDFLTANNEQVEIEDIDSLLFNINLERPIVEASVENLSKEVFFEDIAMDEFTLHNSGSGTFKWTSEINNMGLFVNRKFDLTESINIAELMQNERIYTAIEVNDLYFVATDKAQADEAIVYVTDKEGNLQYSFLQPILDENPNAYISNMTYDGDLLWCSMADKIVGISLQGDLIRTLDSPLNPTRFITWDETEGHFWIGSVSVNVCAIDRNGNVLDKVILSNGIRFLGIGIHPNPEEEYRMFALSKNSSESPTVLYKRNLDNANSHWLIENSFDDISLNLIGLQIVSRYVHSNNVILSINRGEALDKSIETRQLSLPYQWLILEPSEGEIHPNEEQLIQVHFQPYINDSLGYEYEAEILIKNDQIGEIVIPVQMEVAYNSVDGIENTLPTDFTIESIYPNPFNSFSTVRFTLPSQSHVKLAIYDINGRLVQNVVQKQFEAGVHSVVINGQSLASGVYFVRLDAGDIRLAKKIALVK